MSQFWSFFTHHTHTYTRAGEGEVNLPLYGADNVGWLKDESKGHAVAHENTSKQNITQLTSRGAYNGRLIVPGMEFKMEIERQNVII